MAPEESPDELYDRLRRLVASDPKQARAAFGGLLSDGPAAALRDVLERATRPGEGRMRQMIATAARLENSATVVEPWLRRWLAAESDEFTREAVSAALRSAEPAPPAAPRRLEMPAHFVEAYRYAAERLCHRVRNPLTRSAVLLLRLEQLARDAAGPREREELTAIYGDLQTFFQRVNRVVEFDVEGNYTAWRTFRLGEWLENAAPMLAGRHGTASLAVRGAAEGRQSYVRATEFLLETVFGNVWANAVQAAEQAGEAACRITVDLRVADGQVEALLSDSGPGFLEQQTEAAFRFPFSTKSETRGRGLLEIAEAVGRLQGGVRLVAARPGEYRIQIRLPAERP